MGLAPVTWLLMAHEGQGLSCNKLGFLWLDLKVFVHHKHYHCGVITNIFAIAGFQECCCCMRWSKEPAHCQTMAAEDRLLNATFFLLLHLGSFSCSGSSIALFFFCIFSHAHSKCFALFLRHSGGVQYSGGEDSWSRNWCWSGGDRPCAVHRWWYRSCVRAEERSGRRDGGILLRSEGELARGQEVVAWAIKESRCFEMIDILLNAHNIHRFWLWLVLIVYYCSWRWMFWETGAHMLTSQVLTYCF